MIFFVLFTYYYGKQYFFYHHYFLHETIRNDDITRCRFRVCDAARVQFATGSIILLCTYNNMCTMVV